MQRPISVMGNVARHFLGSIERAFHAMAITGFIVAVLVALGTEATGYVLTKEISGPTHLVAAALAIAFGYAAAVTVAIGEILRGIIKGIEMIVQESEHLAQEGLHEAEVMAHRAEADALQLGRAALGDVGALGRGVIGGAEGLEHGIASHLPGHHPAAQVPGSADQGTYAPQSAPEPTHTTPTGGSRRDRGSDMSARTLQFSVFHPNEIASDTASMLLVYTYVAEALAEIQSDAATFTELGSAPKETRGTSTRKVRQGVELTIEPHVDGVAFSPTSDTFIWRGNWRRSYFRLLADTKLDGTTQKGWIDVYGHGMTPIATIELSFSFHRAIPAAALNDPSGRAVTANTFDTVFISYSHRDREALRQAREVYDQFGITVLVDTQIPPGANYEKAIREMIQAANVFHLLWSRNSAASDYVRKEWTDALASDKGERFVRPWYWREPIVHPPTAMEERKISFKYERLRRRLQKPVTWF